MDKLIALYQQRLNLQNAAFSSIEHENATVGIAYKITQPNGPELILKICPRPNDYLREVYFLKHLAGTVPVPRILRVIPPETGLHGAILMERLPGDLITDLTDELAYGIGAALGRIHLNRPPGYGDLIQPHGLSSDPRAYFSLKFEEGFDECSQNLPKALQDRCRRYFDAHVALLATVDGPCFAHRDFRPGNVMVYEGKLQGIIDWASARASFAEEDFCPLEHGEWPTQPPTKKRFLAGYASIRPVSSYSAVMPLLRLSRAIATLGFMVKRGTWDSTHSSVYQFNRRFLETFI